MPVRRRPPRAIQVVNDSGEDSARGLNGASGNSRAERSQELRCGPAEKTPDVPLPAGGMVVLDVEEGGIAVPSFLGKNLRSAVEAAQDAGLDLDAVGSGVAREQQPAPGSKSGSRIARDGEVRPLIILARRRGRRVLACRTQQSSVQRMQRSKQLSCL